MEYIPTMLEMYVKFDSLAYEILAIVKFNRNIRFNDTRFNPEFH